MSCARYHESVAGFPLLVGVLGVAGGGFGVYPYTVFADSILAFVSAFMSPLGILNPAPTDLNWATVGG
jgi:hypothetical protein